MEELKPCPFCGGEAKMIEDYSSDSGYWYRVDCLNSGCMGVPKRSAWDNYGVSTGWRDTEQEATNAWNARAERTCTPDEDGKCECGTLVSWTEKCAMYVAKDGYQFESIKPLKSGHNYCPKCGAKVVGYE